ncbi:MAG: 1-deoxy-D-xylulose-5-phosphate synthase, partial [Nitrospinae bacterium]|nr:1-deoxy-D-xylulose-5-phosphate synthase [Nitrospinota bacterium]
AKPVDAELVLKYAALTHCVVTVEEHSLQGGFGSAVLEVLQENDALTDLYMKRIGVCDAVIEHGAPNLIRRDLELDIDGIFKNIMAFYNSVADRIPLNPGKKSYAGNGSKNHPGPGEKDYHGNGKKSPLKVKQSVNG